MKFFRRARLPACRISVEQEPDPPNFWLGRSLALLISNRWQFGRANLSVSQNFLVLRCAFLKSLGSAGASPSQLLSFAHRYLNPALLVKSFNER